MRVHRDPLRAIHFGGADLLRRLAGEDQHFGLVAETVLRRQAVLAELERNPAPFALQRRAGLIAVELRHVQRPFVQQRAIIGRIGGVDHAFGNVLIDMFAALVVTHVHHQTAIFGHGHRRVLVLEAAQRGVLDGRRGRIQRVNLDDPAVAVEFVGVLRHVEALVIVRPVALRFADLQRVALLFRRGFVISLMSAKVGIEVFFAGQVGAPRRLAVGAVAESAQHLAPARIGGGLQQRVPGGRAAELHFGIGGDAAVIARRALHLPALAVADALYRHDGDAVRRLRFTHLFQAGGLGAAVGEQVLLVNVFVIDGHHAMIVIDREEAHAVVIVAELFFLIGGAVVALRIEGRRAVHQRLAPGDQHLGAVARRDGHLIGGRRGDALKAQQLVRRQILCQRLTGDRPDAAAEKTGQADGAGAAEQQFAASGID